MKKRIISIIAAVAMLVTALPTSFAENASDEYRKKIQTKMSNRKIFKKMYLKT